ncbi:ATP-binding protein [Streptomyces sp. ISL-36]|uniref:ATP-binding protein n=1 Tax=Streptomyces sp. ISL-36 TaxID=2819182 RepID=UPI001BEB25E6|nr:ATP-binding protein [Streptomyces sp. ISL-36]MBT2443304.1 ATP-binding protein [Streptomyces sp. ISL-36]
MSLPLTRRIARAALLVAAGAAPVVGAAGSASALDHSLAPTGALSGISSLDGAAVGKVVGSASQAAPGVAGDAGGKVVGKAAPVAGKTVGKLSKKATETAGAPATDAVGEALPTQGVASLGGLPIGG